jgi:prepilin-type N-terminal cleavage/methylation domain-containing protein/prepilin-type processing-associated H-X9-DG protein
MSRNRSSRKLAGFTLVELLVVIGIVTVLIALLLPALSKAKEAGNRTTCLANQRQLVAAWHLYADDNRGWMVRSVPEYARRVDKPIPWIMLGLGEAAMADGALWKYLRNTAVYHCPGDDSAHLVSYSINVYLRGAESHRPIQRRNQIRRGAEVFAFIDHNDLFPQLMGFNMYGFLVWPANANVWYMYPGWWHNNGACISFVDGHAEYWRWSLPQTLRHDYNDKDASKDPRDLRRLQAVRGGEKIP